MSPISPISDEMFDRHAVLAKMAETGRTDFPVQSDRFLSAGQTGPTGPSDHIVLNQREVSTSTQPNSSSSFDKMLADYKNDLANLLRESFGVDVRSKTRTYQKSYPTSFDSVAYPAGFRLPEFVKFSGEDTRSTFEHISWYLAQLEKLVR